MACRKCGSDWTTPTGKDCNRCPHCDKQQLFQARKLGRWAEPTQVKQCVQCGKQFTAAGVKHIKQRILCDDPACRKAHRKAGINRRRSGVFVGPRPGGKCKPDRFCKRCGKGPLNRNQRDYCGRECAGADAREFKRQFMGMPAMLRQAASFASWFVDLWEPQRPQKRRDYKPRPACEVCQAECNHRNARCCSHKCKKLWRGARKCKCGTVVENATLFGRPYCNACKRESKRIQRRLYGCYRRRCRTYGGFFNKDVKPSDVFKRDGYICHICHKKTHRIFSHDDLLSATVDHHPIPLSKGGDHDWDNVKCACKRCNELKGNKWDKQTRFKLCLT